MPSRAVPSNMEMLWLVRHTGCATEKELFLQLNMDRYNMMVRCSSLNSHPQLSVARMLKDSKLELSTTNQVAQAEDRERFVAAVFSSLYGSSYVWGPIAAILLQLAIIVLLLVVLRTEIFVDNWASSSSSIHLVYVTLLTVLATLITSFTTGSIRKLWFHRSAFLSGDSSSSTESSIKVLVGLGALADQFKGWQVSMTFVFAGLITTSIVAGLTPRSVIRRY